MNKRDKVLSGLSLAAKAGKIASGEFSTEKAVREKKAHLVIVAGDASDNTKKNFKNMCHFYKVPLIFYSDKIALGNAIGKEFRASMAVTDAGLATMIGSNLDLEVD